MGVLWVFFFTVKLFTLGQQTVVCTRCLPRSRESGFTQIHESSVWTKQELDHRCTMYSRWEMQCGPNLGSISMSLQLCWAKFLHTAKMIVFPSLLMIYNDNRQWKHPWEFHFVDIFGISPYYPFSADWPLHHCIDPNKTKIKTEQRQFSE